MSIIKLKSIGFIFGLIIILSCEKEDLADADRFLFPIGTEVLVSGNIYDIAWNSGYANQVSIGLYEESELLYQIAVATENDGLFEWEITDEVPAIEKLNLKIISSEQEILIESKQELRILPKPLFSSFTDERDGKTYRTVKIGEQWWMAENFRYITAEGYYEYDTEDRNIVYGCLYSQEAAIENSPSGWHLPTDEEWNELESYLGLPDEEIYIEGNRGRYVGDLLKYESGLGFDALYGGYRNSGYDYNAHEGWEAHFWSSSTHEGRNIVRIVVPDNGGITKRYTTSHSGCSVRYIKDSD